jgi:hypothetical protein
MFEIQIKSPTRVDLGLGHKCSVAGFRVLEASPWETGQ